MESKEYTVKIGGFKSKEAAHLFMKWYESQGEVELCKYITAIESKENREIDNSFLIDMNSYNEDELSMDMG